MRDLTEANLTEAVIASLQNTEDPRLKEIMTSLVRHLHAFIREVKPSDREWMQGIRFLTEVGHKCDDLRQEFILLSDTLGVTALKDVINYPLVDGATEATVLGPFHREGAPEVPSLHNIAGDFPGDPTLVFGKVTGVDGEPIANAQLDVWEGNSDGFYDVQLQELDGAMALRGRLRSDENGGYIFRTIKPVSYPVPTDGPVGVMLDETGRPCFRPAHIHFILSADGYRTLTTHIFSEGDPNLESDPVFGVKDSLVIEFIKEDSPEEMKKYGFTTPFYKAEYDFSLIPA